MSISQFKSYLLNHYRSVTELVYDVEIPQTFKTICVKCHACRTMSSLLVKGIFMQMFLDVYIYTCIICVCMCVCEGVCKCVCVCKYI